METINFDSLMATDNPEAAGLIYLNLYSVIKASHNNSNHLQLPFKAARIYYEFSTFIK